MGEWAQQGVIDVSNVVAVDGNIPIKVESNVVLSLHVGLQVLYRPQQEEEAGHYQKEYQQEPK